MSEWSHGHTLTFSTIDGNLKYILMLNPLVILSVNNLEATQKKFSRLTAVFDQTMIVWPSGR